MHMSRKFIENLERQRYLDPDVKERLASSAGSGMVKVQTTTTTGPDGLTSSKRAVRPGLYYQFLLVVHNIGMCCYLQIA